MPTQAPAWQLKPTWQSVFEAQLVWQALVPQTYGRQLCGGGDTHMPVPLQTLAGTKVDPMQLCTPQVVPAGRGTQLPATMLQARHGPVQAVLQQTPLAQMPEAH
jgi:hypothetical protein